MLDCIASVFISIRRSYKVEVTQYRIPWGGGDNVWRPHICIYYPGGFHCPDTQGIDLQWYHPWLLIASAQGHIKYSK